MTVLYSTLFGSHLYGTNTPTSDLDIKRIVLPSLDDLLLCKRVENKVKKTNTAKNTKNSVDDVDQEDIPLQVFVRDFTEGQTYALEIAFSVDGSHAKQSYHGNQGALFGEMTRQLRSQFLTSNVKAMMGYVFNQANIYSFKGERLNCAREFSELLKTMFTDPDAGDDQLHDSLPDPDLKHYKENLGWLEFPQPDELVERGGAELAGSRQVDALLARASHSKAVPNSYAKFYGPELGAQVEKQRNETLAKFEALAVKYPKYFRITTYDIGGGRVKPCFVLLEKTFPWSNTLSHSLHVAETIINKYGSRAEQASEANVDWKAMMHAVRIIDEGLELLESRTITLPRPDPARLLKIKRGELPLEPLKDELVTKLDRLKEVSATCGLPQSTDPQFKEKLDRFTLGWLHKFYNL